MMIFLPMGLTDLSRLDKLENTLRCLDSECRQLMSWLL